MRLRWHWAVAVGLTWIWGMGFGGGAAAADKLLWVAQADNSEMIDIAAGPQNPQMTLEINDGIAALSALQVTVTAPPQRNLVVDTVTIGFGLPFGEEITTGNESFLDELRAQLIIEDIEVNSIQDNGEVSEGTQAITDLEDPATVVFALNPPLLLAADTAATFLVVVDINQPALQSAAVLSFPSMAAWLLLSVLGFISYASRSASTWCRIAILSVLLCSSGLLLTGCSGGGGDDELRFVVNLPSNGLSGAGQRLGPENAIAGTTIRLMR